MATVLEDHYVSIDSYRAARPVVDFDQARDLTSEYGTPLICVSRSAVLRNYEALRDWTPRCRVLLRRQVQSRCDDPSHAPRSGCSIDICSVGELQAALEAGFEPHQMLHTHPCKTLHNLQTATMPACDGSSSTTATSCTSFISTRPT